MKQYFCNVNNSKHRFLKCSWHHVVVCLSLCQSSLSILKCSISGFLDSLPVIKLKCIDQHLLFIIGVYLLSKNDIHVNQYHVYIEDSFSLTSDHLLKQMVLSVNFNWNVICIPTTPATSLAQSRNEQICWIQNIICEQCITFLHWYLAQRAKIKSTLNWTPCYTILM